MENKSAYDQIFNTVLEYHGLAGEYVTLPKESFNEETQYTFGGVLFSDKEDKQALQKTLSAGYRPKNGIKVITLHKTGMDYSRTLISGFSLALIFTVISTSLYSFVLDLSSLNRSVRIWIVLVPIYLLVFLAAIIFFVSASTNKGKEVNIEYIKVTSEEVLNLRKELFSLKRRFGEDSKLLNLLYSTVLLDEAFKSGDSTKYNNLYPLVTQELNHYRDSKLKRNYYISEISTIGGVSYKV